MRSAARLSHLRQRKTGQWLMNTCICSETSHSSPAGLMRALHKYPLRVSLFLSHCYYPDSLSLSPLLGRIRVAVLLAATCRREKQRRRTWIREGSPLSTSKLGCHVCRYSIENRKCRNPMPLRSSPLVRQVNIKHLLRLVIQYCIAATRETRPAS